MLPFNDINPVSQDNFYFSQGLTLATLILRQIFQSHFFSFHTVTHIQIIFLPGFGAKFRGCSGTPSTPTKYGADTGYSGALKKSQK